MKLNLILKMNLKECLLILQIKKAYNNYINNNLKIIEKFKEKIKIMKKKLKN